MTVFRKDLDWGYLCDVCSYGSRCAWFDVLMCPVDGTLLLYSESVEGRKQMKEYEEKHKEPSVVYNKVPFNYKTDEMAIMTHDKKEYVIDAFTINCHEEKLKELLWNDDVIEIGSFSHGVKVYFLRKHLHKEVMQ